MIKAKIKSAPKWKEYKTCSLGISLQSQNHVGDKLAAMVDWINSTGHFERCVVDLSDTLHRHNLALQNSLSPAAAHEMASRLGDEWLAENQKILDRLSIPHEVIRWDSWLSHPRLGDNRMEFDNAFLKDKNFRAALLRDVGHFFDRTQNKPLKDVPEEAIRQSMEYLLEELAVHSLFFEKYPCATIYPGRQQESFRLVRDGLVPNAPQGMTHSCFVSVFLYEADERPVHGLYGANDLYPSGQPRKQA